MEIGSLIIAFQYYQLQSLIWSWLAENASFTGRITETGTQFGQVDIIHSTDPICINCPRNARDLYENGLSSSLIRTFSSSAKRTSAPVKLRWSSNAHLDLEGKTVSKWKLEQNSHVVNGKSRLKIIHLRASHGHTFPWASGGSGGLAAIASRMYETTVSITVSSSVHSCWCVHFQIIHTIYGLPT